MDAATRPDAPATQSLRIDIVSDVVCPWCIIGFKRLQQAMDMRGDTLRFAVSWQPFELNPHMPPDGQNLREHIIEKYGISEEQSRVNRESLVALGAQLGFAMRFTDDSRIYNTFQAHQLLHWAAQQAGQTALKLALFDAYFRHGRNVSDPEVLLDCTETAGLDRAEARAVLADRRYADAVRRAEDHWTSAGIQGVPAFIFEDKYVLSGAQPAETFQRVFDSLLAERAA